MDVGIAVFTGSATFPDRLARAVEERGFESLFYAEHTHIPRALSTLGSYAGPLPALS